MVRAEPFGSALAAVYCPDRASQENSLVKGNFTAESFTFYYFITYTFFSPP